MIFKGKTAVRVLGEVFSYFIKEVDAICANLDLFPSSC